jgi:AraC-like DNA-binding protein
MKNIPVRHIKKTQEQIDSAENFNIRDVKILLNGKDMFQEVHRHDFFLIFALKKGNGIQGIDFTSYKVSDNSFFILRPGQVHQLDLKADCTGYLMQFNTEFYYPKDQSSVELLRKATSKNFCQLENAKVKKLFDILDFIFQEFTEKQEGYHEVIKANLAIFFIEFVRNRQNINETSNSNTIYIQERMEELLDLLEKNIATNKQVSQYAEMMHLTSYQLNAITKSALGKTCSELINETVILETKRNLLATSNQVNQIAYHLGYDDVSYFIRFFKKHTGYSPDVFRNKFK